MLFGSCVFFSPFSIAITSLGEERANLSVFRTFVRFMLVWFYRFSLPLGVWDGLRFVIVALPGAFPYPFLCQRRFFFSFFFFFCRNMTKRSKSNSSGINCQLQVCTKKKKKKKNSGKAALPCGLMIFVAERLTIIQNCFYHAANKD